MCAAGRPIYTQMHEVSGFRRNLRVSGAHKTTVVVAWSGIHDEGSNTDGTCIYLVLKQNKKYIHTARVSNQ